MAEKQYRINVYEDQHAAEMGNGNVIARVRYNAVLDYWNGRNYENGGTGRHKGLTKLRDGRYVLIHGTQWEGERDYAYVISTEQALQEILKSGNGQLLDTKKYRELKAIYEATMIAEEEDDEWDEKDEGAGSVTKVHNLKDLLASQYVVYDGSMATHSVDISTGDHTTIRFEQLPDMTLAEIKAERPAVYDAIVEGGIEGLGDDYAVEVYEIDDGRIYRLLDWQ